MSSRLLAWVCVAVFAAPIAAQTDEAAPDGQPAAGDPAAVSSPAPEASPLLHLDSVVEQWAARQKALLPRKSGGFRRANALFIGSLSEHGIHGQPGGTQAFDLAHAAIANSVLLQETDVELAAAEAELAVRLAPDLPSAHARLAEVRLAQRDLGATASRLVAWGESIPRNPWVAAAFAGRLALAIAIAFPLGLLLLAIVFAARAFRLLAFDIHNVLPRGAARWQVQVVLVAVFALPLVVAAGPLLIAAAWLALTFTYLSRRERVLVLLLLAFASASPYALDRASRLWTWPGSAQDLIARATVDVGADRARDALKEQPKRTIRGDTALAFNALRVGDLERASAQWSALAKRDQGYWVEANLGVALASLGRESEALEHFSAAMKDKRATAAGFNAGIIHYKQGKTTEGETDNEFVGRHAGKDELERFRAITFKSGDEAVSHNRAFVVTPPPAVTIDEMFSERPAATRLRAELGELLYFGLANEVAAGFFAGVFLLLVVLWRLRERFQPSRPCSRCGAPASERYDGVEVPRDHCSACYHAFIARGSVEAGMKLRKERQVVAYQRRQRRISRWLTLPLPGFGHLFAGATVRGALVAGFALLLVGVSVALFGPLPWPEIEGWQNLRLLMAPPGLVLVGTVLLAFWRAGRLYEKG